MPVVISLPMGENSGRDCYKTSSKAGSGYYRMADPRGPRSISQMFLPKPLFPLSSSMPQLFQNKGISVAISLWMGISQTPLKYWYQKVEQKNHQVLSGW